jgi:kynureninase
MSAPDPRNQAARLDAVDSLGAFRDAFALPRGPDGQPLIYLCGHSLGLAPRDARKIVIGELDDWELLGVLGHEQARHPWIGYAEMLQQDLAELCGAEPAEVVAMNSLTVNLHLLLAGFYHPGTPRRRILLEAGAFSSDRHVITSQLRWHGLDPAAEMIELTPRPGDHLLRIEDIEARIATEGESLALILWPGVQYRTGQCFDLARIAAAARRVGAVLCLDLAHAIGNVLLDLHGWAVDCAAWCSYKYLNGGPGAIGGAFVHRRHQDNTRLTPLLGWWGHEPDSRFQMPSEHLPAEGAMRWQLSNPPILSTAPLLASLREFHRAGMQRLRAKSIQLTDFLESLLLPSLDQYLQLLTPHRSEERGAQLSLRLFGPRDHARRVYESLLPRGVVADWREPHIIRIAPAPMYTSFDDVRRAAEIIAAAVLETR